MFVQRTYAFGGGGNGGPVALLVGVLFSFVGFVFLAVGITWLVTAHAAAQAFTGDASCVRPLTMTTPVTPPGASGACAIANATVVGTRRSTDTDAHRTTYLYYLDVRTTSGLPYEILLENRDGTNLYGAESGRSGDPAIVESFHGKPVLVATAAGAASGQDDPQSQSLIALIFVGLGAVFFVVGGGLVVARVLGAV